MSTEMVPTSDDANPLPTLAGTFAIYDDGHGGFVLVTDVGGDVTRKHIPAAIVKMATGGGVLGGQLRKLMGG